MTLSRAALVCVAGAMAVTSFAQDRSADDPRVERVLSGLRNPVAIKGRPDTRWTIDERMAALRVPGVSIAVVDNGRIAWAGGFGVRTAGGREPVTDGTLFQAQSISKVLTATAVLALVDMGRLMLDAPVNAYLTSWHLPNNEFQASEQVTIRRLLSHSAGVTVGGFAGYRRGERLPTLRQILDGAAPANNPAVRVDAVPGSISRYSGGGFMVLQQALVDVTAESFPALMQRLVLGPAGMRLSTYDQPLTGRRAAAAASGHDGEGRVVEGGQPVQPELAAGGLWTTPTDLARWMISLAYAWTGQPGAPLSRRMVAEMLSVQKAPFGLGPELEGSGDTLSFSHAGSIWGFRAHFVMYPTLGKGSVIMANGDGADALIPELLTSIATEFAWPRGQQIERDMTALTTQQLDAFAGRYSLPPGPAGAPVYLDIMRTDDHLAAKIVGLGARAPFELFPAADDVFFTTGGLSLSFARDRFGQVATVRLGPIEGTRQP